MVMTERTSRRFSRTEESFRYKIAYTAVLFLSLLWCSLFIGVPFLAEGSPASRRISAMITLFFSPVCHQAPDRSFHLRGYPMAVCARCTGIYVGFLVGILIHPLFRRLKRGFHPPRWVLGAGILPTGMEILLSRGGVAELDLFFRSLTGLILGTVVAFYVIPAVFDLVKSRQIK
jgi:uncharacterized membrane protein